MPRMPVPDLDTWSVPIDDYQIPHKKLARPQAHHSQFPLSGHTYSQSYYSHRTDNMRQQDLPPPLSQRDIRQPEDRPDQSPDPPRDFLIQRYMEQSRQAFLESKAQALQGSMVVRDASPSDSSFHRRNIQRGRLQRMNSFEYEALRYRMNRELEQDFQKDQVISVNDMCLICEHISFSDHMAE